MTKHESKTDFLHKISKDFVSIFSNTSIFSQIEAKRKSNLENHLYCSLSGHYQEAELHWC